MDKRVTAVAALYPALSDVTGYLHHRAGGWPHYFAPNNYSVLKKINGLENTLSYYDVVNFAKRIRVPGFYSWGFNDVVCPPTSMYASYNGISAPKALRIYKETGHWTHPDQKNEWFDWIRKQTEKMK
ncbi:acetylxylan esterase [Sphingobacterium sp. E70]|nr:acetylxylan esterase [Sphingobacterium sp. E70]ULT22314.1 acetylxylan esterase [Sphingobacterium sp. E70]